MCMLSVSIYSCMVGDRKPRSISEHICTLTRSKGLKDLITLTNISVSASVDSSVVDSVDSSSFDVFSRNIFVELAGRL